MIRAFAWQYSCMWSVWSRRRPSEIRCGTRTESSHPSKFPWQTCFCRSPPRSSSRIQSRKMAQIMASLKGTLLRCEALSWKLTDICQHIRLSTIGDIRRGTMSWATTMKDPQLLLFRKRRHCICRELRDYILVYQPCFFQYFQFFTIAKHSFESIDIKSKNKADHNTKHG